MKYILFIFFSITTYAQSDSISRTNISVISAEKLNVVYRGIDNPIKIAVPGAKSFTATAKDSALVKIDDLGNYRLTAGSGTEIKINIDAIMQDNSTLHEEKTFRIMGLPAPIGTLNDDSKGSFMMTKEMLMDSQVNIIFENMLLYECNVDFGVKQFNIMIPLKHNKRKVIIVEGNKMNLNVNALLLKAEQGSIVIITEIKLWNKTDIFIDKPPSPIAIEIY